MEDEIFTLARLLGQVPEEKEEALRILCRAAEAELRTQLRAGTAAEDCGPVFPVAAAWTALADLYEGGQATGVESFSAGDLTVRMGSASREGASDLRRRARELMQSYRSGEGFAFRGVRG